MNNTVAVLGPPDLARAVANRFQDNGAATRVAELSVDDPGEAAAGSAEASFHLDAGDHASIDRFRKDLPCVDLLVNIAVRSHGIDWIGRLDERRLTRLWEVNVLGFVRIVRALLPSIKCSEDPHVISVSGMANPLHSWVQGDLDRAAITRMLRNELAQDGVRVTEIAPGLLEQDLLTTDFVTKRASVSNADLLSPDDIADCVYWAATRPRHVNIETIVLRPTAQTTGFAVLPRREPDVTDGVDE